METIISFLKFGQENNIKDLYFNGTIYMNSIQYFRNLEDGELRGDRYEGISRIRNYPPGKFEIPDIGYKGNHLGIHIEESYSMIYGNIYSLFCVSSNGWKRPEDCNMEYHEGFVKYYDKNVIDRKITLFEKPLEFEYQKEFRFYINRQSDNAFIFNIGSLTNISEMLSSEEVIDTFELRRAIN